MTTAHGQPWIAPALLLVVCAAVVTVREPVARWLDHDACLDAGGSWNHGSSTCELAPPPVEQADPMPAHEYLRIGDYWSGQELPASQTGKTPPPGMRVRSSREARHR